MSDIESQINANLETVTADIQRHAEKVSRTALDINLVAVSKKQPLKRIETMLELGHRLFGENRIQDAMNTWEPLKEKYPDVKLHLIGALQTNKVKEAVSLFDVIETIDRPKLAEALANEMKKQGKDIPCFIQVNTGEEEQKSGVIPSQLPALLNSCKSRNINVVGLMCLPPVDEPSALHFAFLKKLAEEHGLKELSMGMSNDFEKAIPLGATYIRVGTALFGERS